jgi:predicted nucleic acid-binding protein
MSAADFFDSNVLLYFGSSDASKAGKTEALLADGGTISIQVLDEFASVSQRKFRRTMSEIRIALDNIRVVCDIVATDLALHEKGLDIAERYRFSIYDSMLVAAALQANCTTFYTEDLQHGQVIEGLTVRNPFIS